MRLTGKVSWFGGPDDMGVSPSEGLAFIYSLDMAPDPDLFLPEQPAGTTGLARRLNPDFYYLACRWDYDAPNESKEKLLKHKALVRAPATGRQFIATPADWGPNENTGRVADVSKGLLDALGISTDEIVQVIYPFGEEEAVVGYHRVCISSGHGSQVPGASGVNGIKEHDEAVRVVNAVAAELRSRGVTALVFHDDTSTTQQENLETIVAAHNAQTRDLDCFVHFNSSDTASAHGTEAWWVTQEELAGRISMAIADAAGLTDRGAKYSDDLYVLNHSEMPAVLIEVCFVTSPEDVRLYQANFNRICSGIAQVLAGVEPSWPGRPDQPEPKPAVTMELTVPDTVDLFITINGERMLI